MIYKEVWAKMVVSRALKIFDAIVGDLNTRINGWSAKHVVLLYCGRPSEVYHVGSTWFPVNIFATK